MLRVYAKLNTLIYAFSYHCVGMRVSLSTL